MDAKGPVPRRGEARPTMGTLRRDRGVVRRGRPGLAWSPPSGLVAVGIPAASSLSRIFVRIGNGLNGPTDTISNFGEALRIVLPGNSNPPGVFRRHHLHQAVMPQAVNGLRNSSTP